jgi:sugar porter (SP) family MFS transporter
MKKNKLGNIFFISFIAALGGYLFGFDFAVISGALPFLRQQFSLNEYWEGFLTASLALGAIFGTIGAGKIADLLGRKKGLMIAAVVFCASSLGMAYSGNLTIFIFMRFSAGIGVGMASVLSPLYIAEIAPAAHRGRLVSINQLTIVIGILVTNLVNYSLRNIETDAWRWMFGLGAVPSILFFMGAFLLPESPRWLMLRGDDNQARKILSKIGGTQYSAAVVKDIRKSMADTTSTQDTSMFKKIFLPALIVGICVTMFQQLCGINVVFNYTTNIFENIGATKDNQLQQTVFIGLVNLLFTVLAMFLVDKWGRKRLLVFGYLGLAVAYVLIVQFLQVKSQAVSWFLLSAIAIYAMTIAPTTWVVVSEIFPNKIRSKALSLSVLFLWFAYFILVFTFPPLFKYFQDKTFYIYAFVCLIALAVVLKAVKETKGKSLEELEDTFRMH